MTARLLKAPLPIPFPGSPRSSDTKACAQGQACRAHGAHAHAGAWASHTHTRVQAQGHTDTQADTDTHADTDAQTLLPAAQDGSSHTEGLGRPRVGQGSPRDCPVCSPLYRLPLLFTGYRRCWARQWRPRGPMPASDLRGVGSLRSGPGPQHPHRQALLELSKHAEVCRAPGEVAGGLGLWDCGSSSLPVFLLLLYSPPRPVGLQQPEVPKSHSESANQEPPHAAL